MRLLGILVALTTVSAMVLAFIGYWIYQARIGLHLAHEGSRVPGRVIGVRKVHPSSSRRYASQTVPVVQYVTVDGQSMVSSPNHTLQGMPGPDRRQRSNNVVVIYDPARPDRILLEGPGYRSDPTAITRSTVFVVAILGISGVVTIIMILSGFGGR